MMKYLKKNYPQMIEKNSDLEKQMRRNLKKIPDRDEQKFGKTEEGIGLNGE